MFILAFFVLIVLLFLIFITGIIFLIQGPPFVRSDDESSQQIFKLVEQTKPKHIIDMGSGDGKLVIALAKKGYKIDGIELNPRLVFQSRRKIKKHGLEKLAKVKWGNFWAVDVSRYDTVVLYAIKHIMPHLEKKLISELKPRSHIISNFFVFPNLQPVKKLSRALMYEIK